MSVVDGDNGSSTASEAQRSLQEGVAVAPEETKESDSITDEGIYNALVVDSGPIIRLTGLSSLKDRALKYFTVPAVIKEIRDAKAREHLQQLPFDLIPREPSPEGVRAVTEFARKTGDYQSLSAVDIQVLGLLYDLGTLTLKVALVELAISLA